MSRATIRERFSPKKRPEADFERGAALVELAFVLGFLILLVAGIYEIGTTWKTSQSVTQASRDGARVGSQLSTRPESDFEVLKSIEATMGDEMALVTRVVLYEADASGNMPVACQDAAPGYLGGANCNVYGSTHFADLTLPAGPQWGRDRTCGTYDINWCAVNERNDGPNLSALTNFGVQVELDKPSRTELFGTNPIGLSESTVMQLEPNRTDGG